LKSLSRLTKDIRCRMNELKTTFGVIWIIATLQKFIKENCDEKIIVRFVCSTLNENISDNIIILKPSVPI